MTRAPTSEPLISTVELERLYHRLSDPAPAVRRGRGIVQHGPLASPFRGHGLEMADLRPYQWGDDLRHVDWRATARSAKPITKVFLDERLRHVFLVIDRSASMAFGTRGRLKAAMAVHMAAVLAFTALIYRETVAGALWDGRKTVFFPVTGTLDGILAMLHQAARAVTPFTAAGESAPDTGALLERLSAAVPSRASIFLISDFADLEDTRLAALLHLAEHREAAAVHVVDPAELALPDVGVLRVVSPRSGHSYTVDCRDADIRRGYAESMARRHAALDRLFAAADIPVLRTRTDHDPVECLQEAQWTATR